MNVIEIALGIILAYLVITNIKTLAVIAVVAAVVLLPVYAFIELKRRLFPSEWDNFRARVKQGLLPRQWTDEIEGEAYEWDALHEQYKEKGKTSWFVEMVRREIFGGRDRLIRREGEDDASLDQRAGQ